jgi:hypothetical protein
MTVTRDVTRYFGRWSRQTFSPRSDPIRSDPTYYFQSVKQNITSRVLAALT